MKSKSPNKSIARKSLLSFWCLVFLISAGFWLLGAVTATSVPKEASTDLPISSLMIVSPITAALPARNLRRVNPAILRQSR